MSDIVSILQVNNPSREQILRLQHEVAKLPQIELRTEHLISNGVYVRKMWVPAGTVIVGKIHKAEHFFMMVLGDMIVSSEFGQAIVRAGHISIGSPGIKRVGFALTNCVCLNIHRTDKTDLDDIESDIIEPEDTALFDARNHLKTPIIGGTLS